MRDRTATSPTNPCSVMDCDRVHYAKSYCYKHYRRFQKYGDPDIVKHGSPAPMGPERFWSLVDKAPGLGRDGECWEWRGGWTTQGYGKVTRNHRTWLAHRLAWLYITGTDSEKWLLHHCDNSLCVNPDHLYEGDHADNMRDAVERNRMAKGERNPRAKLDTTTVLAIKGLLAKGIKPMAISRRMDIPRPTIVSIQIGRNWKHVSLESEDCR